VIAYETRLHATAGEWRTVGDQADDALSLVARHPLLDRAQLAVLLDTSAVRAGRIVQRLTAAGWIRSCRTINVASDQLWPGSARQRPGSLIELTPAGRREASRRLLLPVPVATRHHGVLGSKTDRRFIRHLAHTRGANAVFVVFVDAAHRLTKRGRDDALEEWRSAAACARGRFRPDGYGCYRRAGERFGFFLEFDRGTESRREYAAKLETYYRYRDSGAPAHDYAGFPVLLVVTTSETAEGRFAHEAYLAAQRHRGAPLSMFLTTTERVRAHPDGVLGPVWRPSPIHVSLRVSWLPDRPVARLSSASMPRLSAP